MINHETAARIVDPATSAEALRGCTGAERLAVENEARRMGAEALRSLTTLHGTYINTAYFNAETTRLKAELRAKEAELLRLRRQVTQAQTPLTLEQLRLLVGKPVWVEEQGRPGCWMIVYRGESSDPLYCHGADWGVDGDETSYGDTWLAYPSLPEPSNDAPLTWEELAALDRMPVWIQEPGKSETGFWDITQIDYWRRDNYGQGWEAWRRDPEERADNETD